MPIFSYKCLKCGSLSEFLIGINQEKSDFNCSSCGSKHLEKMISAFATLECNQGPSGSCSGCPKGGCSLQ